MGYRSDIDALSAGMLQEAPEDSSTYGRKDKSWVKVEPWPIGAVFVTLSPTNPADLLGYGVLAPRGSGRTIVIA